MDGYLRGFEEGVKYGREWPWPAHLGGTDPKVGLKTRRMP